MRASGMVVFCRVPEMVEKGQDRHCGDDTTSVQTELEDSRVGLIRHK
jgi:hypothetical protein